MRVGQNPSKMRGSPAYQPKKVGLASLTYVPALEGYFREAIEVIDVHLTALHDSIDQEVDICVFDNGSCPEVISFLQDRWRAGVIDWLCLSHHNLGKNGALNWIFSAMPNEYIGYADSDVLYRSGWLERSLAIFESFDRAGMVSAQPVVFDFLRGQGRTAQMIAEDGELLTVSRASLPAPVVEEYCDGINASDEIRQQFLKTELPIATNTSTGVRAVTMATDMQFMLSKKVASQLVPLPIAGALTAKDAIDIPRGVENLGYWILSSDEPLVRHMGNTILERGIPEIDDYLAKIDTQKRRTPSGHAEQAERPSQRRLTSKPGDTPPPRGWKQRLRARLQHQIDHSPGLRRQLSRLYDSLFSLLYEERQ